MRFQALLTIVNILSVYSLRLHVSDDGLRSPRQLLSLYKDFQEEFGVQGRSSAEQNLRFRLFKASANFVVEQNKAQPWRSGFNKFSVMTESEKLSYLGFNTTRAPETVSYVSHPAEVKRGADFKYPEEKMWLKSVFHPIDQGNCGSCWIHGSISALEGRYHQLTGRLKRFSKQQMLDCVFAWRSDGGCSGGANYCTYNYLQKGHPLIKEKDYPPYVAKEGSCREDRYKTGLQAAKVVGYVKTHPSEEGLLVALSQGITAVSFEVTAAFYAYEGGVIRDETCHGTTTTHAVTAVGYNKAFILIKNSWGTKWGEDGFVKFGRNHHGCLLHTKPIYPVLELTGKSDTDRDESPTTYSPSAEEPVPKPACTDEYPAFMCGKSRCRSSWAIHCYKTCERCSFDEDTCPSTTNMCRDATCRC